MDIFWTLYCKLDESGRKELIEQLAVKPITSSKVKLSFNQGPSVGLKPVKAIKRPHDPNP